MIPKDFITEWRAEARWVQDFQVEQDLVLSRALVELFSNPLLSTALVLRGGTALYKFHLRPAARYSEDIDLVQAGPGPIGPVLDGIRAALDPWLGKGAWKQTEGRVTLRYGFQSEDTPSVPLRLKVEINSREHFNVCGLVQHPLEVRTRWFTGTTTVQTYALDELLGTKLRALYQRKKGRDLFDLALGLKTPGVNPARVVEAFTRYMEAQGQRVSRAVVEENLAKKREDAIFNADIGPLLTHGHTWNPNAALDDVIEKLIKLLPGERWVKRGPGR